MIGGQGRKPVDEPGPGSLALSCNSPINLLQVCGLLVEQATHKEVVSIIRDRSTLALKVRSGGLLPVKEARTHPVHWLIVQVSFSLSVYWQIFTVVL